MGFRALRGYRVWAQVWWEAVVFVFVVAARGDSKQECPVATAHKTRASERVSERACGNSKKHRARPPQQAKKDPNATANEMRARVSD